MGSRGSVVAGRGREVWEPTRLKHICVWVGEACSGVKGAAAQPGSKLPISPWLSCLVGCGEVVWLATVPERGCSPANSQIATWHAAVS